MAEITDEIDEVRETIARAQALFDDLIVRGLRSVGPLERKRIAALRSELHEAGAGHIAQRIQAVETGLDRADRQSARDFFQAQTALLLLERLLTLEAARSVLTPLSDEQPAEE